MTKIPGVLTIVVIAATVGAAAQRSHHAANAAADITVTGEVIDPVCYLTHGSRGSEHKACAQQCVKQGINLAILEDGTGQVYLSLPVDHSNPNARLASVVAEHVKVTGTLFAKGGVKGIDIRQVARVR